jgi:murein DD-endopeptidase MepM/ murein hydrolase activator NlpD
MVGSRSRSGKKSVRRRVSPARRGTIRLTLVLSALVLVNAYVFLWRDSTSIPAVMQKAHAVEGPAAPPAAPSGAMAEREEESADEPTTRVVEGEVVRGDTLGKILKRQGLSAQQADEVLRALADVLDFKTLRPGQPFILEYRPDGALQAFTLVVSRVKTVRVERGADGRLVGVADVAETRVEVEEVAGRITSSLYAAIKAAGEETALVAFFVDVFAYDLDFYVDQHKGDVFRVLVEKEYAGAELLRYRRILAAEYAGKAGTFRAFRFRPSGSQHAAYYDAEGRSVEKTLLKTPLKYSRISSGFNPKRMHPILHTVRGHYGVDYAAPTGTPVWAAASGVITHRAYSGGPGNQVIIKHADGLVTKYMHLSAFAKGQKVGQRVEAKTVIGYVGSTGLSTGPHLHFSVIQNGRHVDPLKLAPTRGRGVPKGDLAAFKAEVGRTLARLAAIPVRDAAEAAGQDETEVTAGPPSGGTGGGPSVSAP